MLSYILIFKSLQLKYFAMPSMELKVKKKIKTFQWQTIIFIRELIFVSISTVPFIALLHIIYDVFPCYILMEKMVYLVNRIKHPEVLTFAGKWKVVNLFFALSAMKFTPARPLTINMVGCSLSQSPLLNSPCMCLVGASR